VKTAKEQQWTEARDKRLFAIASKAKNETGKINCPLY